MTILEDGVNTGRYFGVETRAAVSERGVLRNGSSINIKPGAVDYPLYRDTPFPVCLFFFTMEDDQGYWKWIREPVLDAPSQKKLILNDSAALAPLTDQSPDTLVETIKRWYEQADKRAPS